LLDCLFEAIAPAVPMDTDVDADMDAERLTRRRGILTTSDGALSVKQGPVDNLIYNMIRGFVSCRVLFSRMENASPKSHACLQATAVAVIPPES
jgi:hypothetical protein